MFQLKISEMNPKMAKNEDFKVSRTPGYGTVKKNKDVPYHADGSEWQLNAGIT